MKYIKTYEYLTNTNIGPLGKVYPGRFKNTLLKHCKELDHQGIDYEIYVSEDPIRFDVVYVVIENEYIDIFYNKIKKLGFEPLSITQENLDKLKKYDNVEEYLKTRPVQEKKIQK